MNGAREQVLELEAQIEALAEAADRCRKVEAAASVAALLGAAWLAAMVLGVLRAEAWMPLAAISALLGGGVLYGSNRSTLQQVTSELKAREDERARIVGAMDLRVVAGSGGSGRT